MPAGVQRLDAGSRLVVAITLRASVLATLPKGAY
jgi:hypothetical protein